MSSDDRARTEVACLVERFARNRDAYQRAGYKEAQVRAEFIDPFFEALGWDVRNVRGYAEQYKDVVHEATVKVDEATRAPDYSFRIGGVRKFFLEAKKPAVSVKGDVGPAYQLRRYAWSARLSLSILTDFEEFAVYDCRVRPRPTDKPGDARVLYLTFDHYLDRFADVYGVFAKESVLQGSFDRYVEDAGAKRGTSEVDDEFLKEIEGWREALARNIALRNPVSVHELNFAVQHTIDRIIFLRMCEDRGIEGYGRLLALTGGPRIYPRLVDDLYRQADEKYNSGLFDFRADALTPALTIDDRVLKPILAGLYYPQSPYVFSVLPAEVLGQVYEQFLGKVIRLTAGHQAKVEEKPEVKKAGGVYYTPAYIVDYIVQQTVGRLVAGQTPQQVGASGRSPLRILDPACGSGSFLLGAYQCLLDYHLRWYTEHDPESHARGKQPAVCQTPLSLVGRGAGGEGSNWRLTTAEKKRILLTHIYGVDIDRQAVEVTKLSLLLKVLEGESQESLGQQLTLWRERALPDLGQNIKCGNSLIGPDYVAGHLLPDEEELRRVNPFDWKAEFPAIMAAGGFDVVIGNPPYGALLSRDEIEHLRANFKLQNYQLDTYLLFVERGLALLREGGLLGMIIPNTWLLNLLSSRIRQHLFAQAEIECIVHYRYPVFLKAVVDTEITVIRKAIPSDNHQITITVIEKDGRSDTYPISQQRWRIGDGKPVNIFERPEVIGLADKLKTLPVLDNIYVITQGAKPFQVGKGKPPQTRKVVDEKPFVSGIRSDPTFRPLLRGSLIQRYRILWNNDYWISFGDWLAEPRYSAHYAASAKIVIRQTGDSLVATLDHSQFIVRDNLYTIVPRNGSTDLRYLLGLLNSQLLNWFYQTIINPERGEALAQVKRGHLAQLPIRPINFSDPADVTRHDRMVALVERMLTLHRQLAAASIPADKDLYQRQIQATDKQIDALVYELYGLTAEEIAVVEGNR